MTIEETKAKLPRFFIDGEPILVTGGAGFIGFNFIRNWRPSLHSPLINLDKLTYAANREAIGFKNLNYSFVNGDICDAALVERLLDECRPHAIIHFAAETHVDRSIASAEEFLRTNIFGTYTMLNATRKYLDTHPIEKFLFLHVSTDEVYGACESNPYTETSPYVPNSPYAASKASSDHLVRAWVNTYDFPAIITNCSNNYGPYQFPEKLIPLMINKALKGEPLPVYGDGQQVRDWLFVEDHCSALRAVLARGRIGKTYNIGGGNQKTNLEVVHKICDLLDELVPRFMPYSNLIQHVEDRPGHDRRYAIDASKIEMELDWHPIESFESGLRKTVEWYIQRSL